MDKKIVICDIDGTLIVKHHLLTPRARDVIENLRRHDVCFGVASGRSMVEIKRMIQSWGLNHLDLMIGLNGSVLWDGIDQKEYTYFILKRAWIKEIIEEMTKYNVSNILMYKGNQLLCTQLDEMACSSAAASKMEAVKVTSLEEFYSEDNAKIMFRVQKEDMEEIEHHFSSSQNENYRAFKTQATLLEFSDVRVSKAYTLKKFCESHAVDMQDVIAFGDTTNDNDMLIASGWGVCLHNGSADTKAIADEVTDLPCDKDGWADYMERKILIPEGWM